LRADGGLGHNWGKLRKFDIGQDGTVKFLGDDD
jgi:hypothetical protein